MMTYLLPPHRPVGVVMVYRVAGRAHPPKGQVRQGGAVGGDGRHHVQREGELALQCQAGEQRTAAQPQGEQPEKNRDVTH